MQRSPVIVIVDICGAWTSSRTVIRKGTVCDGEVSVINNGGTGKPAIIVIKGAVGNKADAVIVNTLAIGISCVAVEGAVCYGHDATIINCASSTLISSICFEHTVDNRERAAISNPTAKGGPIIRERAVHNG